jgi:hypothetical protein
MAIIKKYSKGYGDKWRSPFTAGLCIWEACLAFQAENGAPPTYEYIKNQNLSFTNKKGESELVNPKNIKVEISSYKRFCEQFPDAKELELLKKTPNNQVENNPLDIYDDYQDIQKTENQPILPDDIQGTDNYYEGTKHSAAEELLLSDGEAWEPDAEENWNTNFVGGNTDTRDLAFLAVRLRKGQAAFRNALISEYGPQCMVTGCRVLAVIEAAHIKPYRGIEDHHVQNGLLLRADIHTLFDLNLIGISPKTLEVAVHQTLSGSTYSELAGQRLKLSNGNIPALVELTKR